MTLPSPSFHIQSVTKSCGCGSKIFLSHSLLSIPIPTAVGWTRMIFYPGYSSSLLTDSHLQPDPLPIPPSSPSSTVVKEFHLQCQLELVMPCSRPIPTGPISSTPVWYAEHKVSFLEPSIPSLATPSSAASVLWRVLCSFLSCRVLCLDYLFFHLLSQLTRRPSLDDTSPQKFSLNAPSWIRHSSFVLLYWCKHQKIHCKWA